MKVLQVINSLEIGGAESLVSDLTLSLNYQGIHTDLLILKSTGSFLEKKLNEAGCKVIYLNISSIYNPKIIFMLKACFRDYDIIHTHLFPCLYWVAFASLFNSSIKYLYTEHSTTNRRRKWRITRFIDRLIYKRFDVITGISKPAVQQIEKLLHSTNVKLIENGVDIEKYFKAKKIDRKELNIPKNSLIITMVARFYFPKDHMTVLEALVKLPTNTHVVFVGEGPLMTEVKKNAKIYGITERVHFLGLRNDIPNILKSSDLIVLSSKYEGLSLSSIEAMGANKPFIASDVPGLKEVVPMKELLFKYGDSNSLVECVLNCLPGSENYERLASKCYERALCFDSADMVDKYIECYNQLNK